MPLTDVKIRNAKPKERQYKIFDGDGLYLLVHPKGGKYWRLKYRVGGKEKSLSFGTYPEVPLRGCFLEDGEKDSWIPGARDLCAKARKQLAAGIDPGEAKKARQAALVESSESSFEIVAREWHSKFSNRWSDVHTKTTLDRLKNNAFPWLGNRPISEIEAPELLTVLKKIESRGRLETAHRVRGICSQVFRYAISTGRAKRDPAADLKGALPPAKKNHLAAITDPKKVKELLKSIDSFEGSFVVKCALQLAPLVFVRPGELRKAEWCEINLETSEWNIPAERMKLNEPHLVPLSKQAIEILVELKTVTGQGRYLFPSVRSVVRPISDNTLNAALRRLGFEKHVMTAHGFRAMARTILDEVLQERPDLIEHQLAHAVRDPLGRAYNRTKHFPERKKMMQRWADFLDELKEDKTKVLESSQDGAL
jgi:integrase